MKKFKNTSSAQLCVCVCQNVWKDFLYPYGLRLHKTVLLTLNKTAYVTVSY